LASAGATSAWRCLARTCGWNPKAAAERERCALFNEQLGVAIVNAVSRVKGDERTVKILTAINVASDLLGLLSV